MTRSPLKLYLDEHIGRELSKRLRDKGYDAVHGHFKRNYAGRTFAPCIEVA
jgi:hypothetical protein